MWKTERKLKRIENKLQSSLQPVEPRADFVEDLHNRLMMEMEQKTKTRKVKKGLLVAGGIVGGTVMVVTIIRTLTSWEEFTDSLSQFINRNKKEQQIVSA